MKLYFASHVCSLVPHIVLRELGASFDLVRVDLRSKKVADGRDLTDVTPKSYVPALELDDGNLLTEVAVIVHHLADSHPEAKLAPARGTMARVRFDELVHFIATELHKGFAPFTLMPNPGDETKEWARTRLAHRVSLLETALGDKRHFTGDDFTIADAYAFWALRTFKGVTRQDVPASLAEYLVRVGERPSVKAALEAEKAK
jgi:glutathione S-transferase